MKKLAALFKHNEFGFTIIAGDDFGSKEYTRVSEIVEVEFPPRNDIREAQLIAIDQQAADARDKCHRTLEALAATRAKLTEAA